jgi:hypothetical protein
VSIEKLRKDEELATRTRVAAAAGRAVAVVCGRSDLGPNIPFKWLHRPFLSVIFLLTAYNNGEGRALPGE